MSTVYATNKLAWHPAVLDNLRAAAPQAPVLVQIMPTHVCNQCCQFCTYGSGPENLRAKTVNPAKALWKNQQLYDTRASLSEAKMLETVACMARMGVAAVEITGGGEPTVYPHYDALVAALADTSMEVALVTNGTRMTPERADALGRLPFVWVRVSIDAGTVEDYCRIRNVPPSHWTRAWDAVRRLAEQKRQPYAHAESTVGIGFVVDRDNWRGVYEACRLAKDAGADNIRISASFTPDGMSRFDSECLTSVPAQVAQAKRELEDATFTVNDLSGERFHNLVLGRQEYPFCAWKDVGCVVGADANVYACCSLAFNRLGLMYSIADQDFETGWNGEGATWRREHDPRRMCKIHCLYERRNLEALTLMGDRTAEGALRATQPAPRHRNFI